MNETPEGNCADLLEKLQKSLREKLLAKFQLKFREKSGDIFKYETWVLKRMPRGGLVIIL